VSIEIEGMTTHAMTTVVKVGGSLYNLPDLGLRLSRWLRVLEADRVVLVPGGGPTADIVRAWHRDHQLGEEAAHWLALHAVSLNARFLLVKLLPFVVLDFLGPEPIVGNPSMASGPLAILDACAFARMDEQRPEHLPHTWAATSDSLAARVAEVTAARRLLLLKSVSMPGEIDWIEAARRGIVDEYFPTIAARLPNISIRVVNFRSFRSKEAP
jgi:aspartokinase-like uncharacterized kinase